MNALANGGEVVSPSLVRGRATTAAGNEVGTETTTRRTGSERAGRTADVADDGAGDDA